MSLDILHSGAAESARPETPRTTRIVTGLAVLGFAAAAGFAVPANLGTPRPTLPLSVEGEARNLRAQDRTVLGLVQSRLGDAGLHNVRFATYGRIGSGDADNDWHWDVTIAEPSPEILHDLAVPDPARETVVPTALPGTVFCDADTTDRTSAARGCTWWDDHHLVTVSALGVSDVRRVVAVLERICAGTEA
ncbi:hypothetical protein ACFW1A_29500 [Kitasatospora sp. NPDC058965]|uniref:hypothetical protein n=1 Tax=Kitasatospora sp. NPDC058965 TaxID=3346682 RepID=UPI0036B2730F